ncbi:hypothetical protein A4A49_27235 [Nicotiana attenuata]|uniref:Retrovirus-related Pol polyprotein from transposon TNT 1-94-like beta-barrel domain-containing protein n=1 Tax=Nicotiana attenuata TaxID=49451 RepID=A0A314L8Q4_NICAT|nr:hypothetical protein A4A49_27235 [Nicotiana attenuata]
MALHILTFTTAALPIPSKIFNHSIQPRSSLHLHFSKAISTRHFSVHHSSTQPQKYVYPDPIPEFAVAETQKFKAELLKKLFKEKEIFGDELDDVVSVCAEEENRRGVILYSAPMEKSGLTVSQEQPKTFTFDKDHMHCEYCGKPRHTRETCWKLHGRPTRGRGGKRVGPSRGQANIAKNMETSKETASGEALSLDEVQHLRRLLNKLDSSNVATSNYVQSGIAFNAHLNSWIIDSGANRHITGSSKGFQNYSPSPKGLCQNSKWLPTPISGTGSVVCTPDITLSSILHVPELPVNMLSVSAITKK